MPQPITLGFSPCPNDTFIFEKLIQPTFQADFDFKVHLADVEKLNRMAFNEELDMTKLSFHAWLYLKDKYTLLNSGSALGRGCGPLLIAKNKYKHAEICNLKIAIPGKYTTANFLLSACFPSIRNKVEIVFSEIENAVLHNEVDAGLIIHENRFTYQNKGLVKLIDMGQWWETTTGCAIPLGGIAIHKRCGNDTKEKIDALLQQSVQWAMGKTSKISDYVKCHAQAMEPDVMLQHINLYVNDFTVDLGNEGWHAIKKMEEYFAKSNLKLNTNN